MSVRAKVSKWVLAASGAPSPGLQILDLLPYTQVVLVRTDGVVRWRSSTAPARSSSRAGDFETFALSTGLGTVVFAREGDVASVQYVDATFKPTTKGEEPLVLDMAEFATAPAP